MYIGQLNIALSSMSFACQAAVYWPQIFKNYKLKSGEGLSVLFLVIWLLSDLYNLGWVLTISFMPMMAIILSVYHCLCDIMLLFQIYYYRFIHSVHPITPEDSVSVMLVEISEQRPLLENPAERPPTRKASDKRIAVLILLLVIALFARLPPLVDVYWQSHDSPGEGGRNVWKSRIIEWLSVTLYSSSRIPQILKNLKTRCAGLSLALFLLALAGNVIFVLSIGVMSIERGGLTVNASWLTGHGLTILLDLVIIGQYFHFKSSTPVVNDQTNSGESS